MVGVTTTDFRVLLRLAAAVGQAEKSGDAAAIAQATAEHDTYRKLCLSAGQMTLGRTYGELDSPSHLVGVKPS